MSAPVGEVVGRIAEVLRRPVAAVQFDTELAAIAPDSFVLVEMVIELQDEFGVRFEHDDMAGLRTVGDVVALVERRRVS
ncbi:MAG TPA: acyl carrier protein [Nakamurella sp.]|jgi:acyl carrier protein|nr:acyl carrier protein [Nakamurella sp.]